jgi:dCMP deaminase
MKWHQRFLELALHISEWRKDPSTKVGAVIVDDKRRVVGTGYNGFPRGIEDSIERLHDRPTKYRLVVHAEANSILNATTSIDGATIYCTHFPCTGCAKLIIQAGIRVMFVPYIDNEVATWADEQRAAAEMFEEVGIEIHYVHEM